MRPAEISVVIPARNASAWLGDTLRSVLAQDRVPSEVLVVDDGSTDDTAAIARRFGAPVTCIEKAHGGTAESRNAGIQLARGKYVAFIDADDLWAPQKLAQQVALLDASGLAWVYSDALAFDSRSNRVLFRFSSVARQHSGDILQSLLLANFIPSSTPVVRKDVLESVGLFDANWYAEDWMMWLKIARDYEVGLVHSPLAYYRVHVASKTGHRPTEMLHGHLSVVERAVDSCPARLSRLKHSAFSRCYFRYAGDMARLGRWEEARRLYVRSILHAPTYLPAYAGLALSTGSGTAWRALYSLRSRLLWRRSACRLGGTHLPAVRPGDDAHVEHGSA